MVNVAKLALATLLLLIGFGPHASAQTWDTSGNGLLRGTSYFREVIWHVGDNSGSLDEAVALYGTITFDGN